MICITTLVPIPAPAAVPFYLNPKEINNLQAKLTISVPAQRTGFYKKKESCLFNKLSEQYIARHIPPVSIYKQWGALKVPTIAQ